MSHRNLTWISLCNRLYVVECEYMKAEYNIDPYGEIYYVMLICIRDDAHHCIQVLLGR